MAEAPPPFVREERYIVIKRKHLTPFMEGAIRNQLEALEVPPVDCVVVESDWPECEKVWRMIEARVVGPIPPAGGNEEFYDREIAPVLSDLSVACRSRGMPFLAGVEYEPGELGRTAGFPGGQSMSVDFANVVLQTGNVDSMLSWLCDYAREHGHSSAFLHQLGIPLKPEMAEVANG